MSGSFKIFQKVNILSMKSQKGTIVSKLKHPMTDLYLVVLDEIGVEIECFGHELSIN